MTQPAHDGTPADGGGVTTGGHVAAWAAVAVLVAAAVVGSNLFSVRERLVGSALPDPVAPATSRSATTAGSSGAARQALRSSPWWQTVASVEGAGGTAVPITIDERAVDWRVSWSCDTGRLRIAARGRARPVVDADCPEGVGFGVGSGRTKLEIRADGPWSLEIAQRVEVPLVERPLPAMTAPDAKIVATGTFRKAQRVGTGNITIYETNTGYLVRLEDFWVNPKSSLQLRLSDVDSPDTAKELLGARSQLLAELDVTSGSLNYQAPSGVDVAGFRSVVVWSPTDRTVYAAASLEEPA